MVCPKVVAHDSTTSVTCGTTTTEHTQVLRQQLWYFPGTSQFIFNFLFFLADMPWYHVLSRWLLSLFSMSLWLKIDTWEETHLIPSFMRAYASHSFSYLFGYSFGGAMCSSSRWNARVLWSRNAEGGSMRRSRRRTFNRYSIGANN